MASYLKQEDFRPKHTICFFLPICARICKRINWSPQMCVVYVCDNIYIYWIEVVLVLVFSTSTSECIYQNLSVHVSRSTWWAYDHKYPFLFSLSAGFCTFLPFSFSSMGQCCINSVLTPSIHLSINPSNKQQDKERKGYFFFLFFFFIYIVKKINKWMIRRHAYKLF